jgi:hypothetical protein
MAARAQRGYGVQRERLQGDRGQLRRQLRELRSSGAGVFVIVGRPSGRVLVDDVSCPFVSDAAFTAKVIRGQGRKGRYLCAPDARIAMPEFGAVRCRHPADAV